MPTLPPATQAYNPALAPMNRITRRATCPQHNKPSMEFAGVGKEPSIWIFRCHATNVKGVKGKTDHYFAARADRSAPQTVAELQPWIDRQLAAKAQVPTRTNS